MHTIDVDFDVFKQLTVRRETETMTYNDVIRELLGLEKKIIIENDYSKTQFHEISEDDWLVKGVRFPNGTEFRATYKGQIKNGRVESAALVVNGKRYESPSAAAVAITKTSVNGWGFWECKLPGKNSWQSIDSLRRQKP